MFRRYGILGLLMIVFVELNFLLQIQPFASWYFPIVWLGYILLVDSIVYKFRRNSLISSRPKLFLSLLALSAIVWWVFEFVNYSLQNWSYQGLSGFSSWWESRIFGTISFATVIPAIFETAMLLRVFHLFDHVKLRHEHKISKGLIYTMWVAGIFSFVAPLLMPVVFFPLIWLSLFLILDPINYLHKEPSIISHLKDRKLAIPATIFAAGMLCGFLWEFWNFWAIPKWTYQIPYVGFFKLFEMPVLGYLGYGPFAWELFAVYIFARSLLKPHKTLDIFRRGKDLF